MSGPLLQSGAASRGADGVGSRAARTVGAVVAEGDGGMAAGCREAACEEPLRDVAYCYDGTLEGLLSAVFQAYELHEDPQDIVREGNLQPRLGQTVRFVETDIGHAERVQRGVRRVCGAASADAVMRASLSDDPDAGTVVYRFVRYAMAQKRPHDCTGCRKRAACPGPTAPRGPTAAAGCSGKARSSVLNDLAHPAVEPLHRLVRAVENERHRMIQFLRFEHLENGVWLARCNPSASVVPLLMDWFCARFNTQPFIVYDESHGMAGVYEGRRWHLVRTDRLSVPDRAADEQLMQAAWKRFYRTVAVEARYNPELRRQHMPKRLWKNILELQDLPERELDRHQPARPGSGRRQAAAAYTPVRSNAGMKLSSAAPPSCQK